MALEPTNQELIFLRVACVSWINTNLHVEECARSAYFIVCSVQLFFNICNCRVGRSAKSKNKSRKILKRAEHVNRTETEYGAFFFKHIWGNVVQILKLLKKK